MIEENRPGLPLEPHLPPGLPPEWSSEPWLATLAYWRECGIDFLVDEPGRSSKPVTSSGESPPPAPITPRVAPPAPPPGGVSRAPVIPKLAPGVVTETWWNDLAREVQECRRCELAQSRTQTVFGIGNRQARVAFVGEAPGAEEDRQGEPFVGAAGQLLDRMIQAIGQQRSEVYIVNVLKCRPPGNRNPLPQEEAACQGYLYLQLQAIAPQAIFALGRFAIQSLLGHYTTIGAMRNRIHHWQGIPVIASYHPAYYLRTPSRKSAAWEDLRRLIKLLRPPNAA